MKYAFDLFIKQNKICAISGLVLKMGPRAKDLRDPNAASLDRIDSSKGYVKGNVQWVHKAINKAKVNSTDEEFITLCKAVAKHNK